MNSRPQRDPTHPVRPSGDSTLHLLEREVAELFVDVAGLLGAPRSVGEIYALLFIRTRPLTLEEISRQLEISAGSTSQGLRFLQGVGLVRRLHPRGERRSHFCAEMSAKHVLGWFLRDRLEPILHRSEGHLARIREELLPNLSPAERPDCEMKLALLSNWRSRASRLLPLAKTIFPDASP